jgi:hypothetical protein
MKTGKKQNKQFDADKAVQLFKAGIKMSEIPQFFGYTDGGGYHRVRAALMKAGVYTATTKRTKAAKPAKAAAEKKVVGRPAVSGVTLLEKRMADLESTLARTMSLVIGGKTAAKHAMAAQTLAVASASGKIEMLPEIPLNGKVELSVPVPTDRETLKKECFVFAESRYKQLSQEARTGWLAEFCGMLWATLESATAPHSIAPVRLLDHTGHPLSVQESIAA